MNNLKSDLSHLYGLAYQHGHHDTVEGGFVDCQWSDRRDYFVDDITTALSEDPECYGAIISLDARIAELTAEVARYKAALEKIASARTNGLPAIHTSTTPDIARNALKEGRDGYRLSSQLLDGIVLVCLRRSWHMGCLQRGN